MYLPTLHPQLVARHRPIAQTELGRHVGRVGTIGVGDPLIVEQLRRLWDEGLASGPAEPLDMAAIKREARLSA